MYFKIRDVKSMLKENEVLMDFDNVCHGGMNVQQNSAIE